MLEKRSIAIASYFVERKIISKEDIDIYSYGMLVLFYYLLNIASFLLLALVFGYLLESVVFLTAFFSLRIFIGGYHSSTHLKCYVVSMLIYGIFLYFIHSIGLFNDLTIIALLIFSGITIFLFSPGDTENKRLTKKEKAIYKKKGSIIYLSEATTVLVLMGIIKFESVVSSIVLAIAASTLLLLILKLMEWRSTNEKGSIE